MNDHKSLTPFSRRQFITSGSAALASLCLLGTASSANANDSKQLSSATQVLFDAPMDADGYYTLPKLPYAYNALEPIIDEETMKLHHDLHFAAYTKGLNDALKGLANARQKQDFSNVPSLENQLAFNGAGYTLHTVFFQNMGPANSTNASDWLLKELSAQFESLENMKAQFTQAALTVQGSGWGILGYQPLGNKLVVLQVEKHQNATQWNVIPILVLDVWEHAYYLKYQNKRLDYINNWWNVVNWKNVEERLKAAYITRSSANF